MFDAFARTIRRLSPAPALALVPCVLLVLSAPAAASVVRRVDVESMARSAHDVVVGSVVQSQSRWDSRRLNILTVTTVRVNENWKGRHREGDVIRIVRRGGTIDGVEMRVTGDATFVPGERALLFLRGAGANPFLVGLGQGKLPMTWDGPGRRWMVPDRTGPITAPITGPITVRGAHPTPVATKSSLVPVQWLHERLLPALEPTDGTVP